MFELVCDFLHCRGRVSVAMGTCASEAEARRWVARHRDCKWPQDGVPSDPHSRCPVSCCALKSQPPRFGYRSKT